MIDQSEYDYLKYELMCRHTAKDVAKDIIIVVHNQLNYTKQCIESIQKCTKNYKLYIWDNGSDKDTQDYLASIEAHVVRSDLNIGFIKPNNTLAAKGDSPYIILLNNDTIVQDGWDQVLLGYLQGNHNCKLVGCLGGILDENGKGVGVKKGKNIDFVQGWCMCLERNTYNQIGLFDEVNLEIAFCEDADLSFRVKECGYEIYALYSEFVFHFGNVTIKEISKKYDTLSYFQKNHEFIKRKWLRNSK